MSAHVSKQKIHSQTLHTYEFIRENVVHRMLNKLKLTKDGGKNTGKIVKKKYLSFA